MIKLDALGDVLRTTPLSYALKKKYPNSYLTWLTKDTSSPILKNNHYIDRILIYKPDINNQLTVEKFDILINLDKNIDIAALATLLNADKKLGFGLNGYGKIYPMNDGAKDHYNICLDNFGKGISNTKTHQEMAFETAEIPYNGEEYVFELGKEESEFANDFYKKHINNDLKIVGINPGASSRYPHKRWTTEGYRSLIERISNEMNVNLLLFGGLEEIETSKIIKSGLEDKLIDTGNNNSLLEFASLLNLCNIVVTGDTSAMHLAIALKKKVVALFGPTRPNEIDLYGRGQKISGKVECLGCYEVIPCIKDAASLPNCMQTISVDEVYNTIKSLL